MSVMLMLDFDKEIEKGEAENADFNQNTQRRFYENFLTQWDSVTDSLQVARVLDMYGFCVLQWIRK